MRSWWIFAIVLIVGSAGSAWAWPENKQGWDRLNHSEQVGYVIGAVDALYMKVQGTEPNESIADLNSIRDDTWQCISERRLAARDLISIVNIGYTDLTYWNLPPYAMLARGIRQLCLETINRLRAERGQEPLQP